MAAAAAAAAKGLSWAQRHSGCGSRRPWRRLLGEHRARALVASALGVQRAWGRSRGEPAGGVLKTDVGLSAGGAGTGSSNRRRRSSRSTSAGSFRAQCRSGRCLRRRWSCRWQRARGLQLAAASRGCGSRAAAGRSTLQRLRAPPSVVLSARAAGGSGELRAVVAAAGRVLGAQAGDAGARVFTARRKRLTRGGGAAQVPWFRFKPEMGVGGRLQRLQNG